MSTPNFPPNPVAGQTYLHTSCTWFQGKARTVQTTWKFNGKGWAKVPAGQQAHKRARR